MQTKTVSSVGEFGLIDLVKKQVGRLPRGIVGIGDDAAVVPLDKRRVSLITTDMLLEGVHFLARSAAADVGYKALACSISDIAAMGGVPHVAVVSVGLPPQTPIRWVTEFYEGLMRAARRWNVSVVGGDTVKSATVVINVTLTGTALRTQVVRRDGARAGDCIFVTGKLGRSLVSGRHLRFVPRVAESQYLVTQYDIHAMIDISDGLAADLGHIMDQSGVGARLVRAAVPLQPRAVIDNAFYDGEDFELLFTVSVRTARKIMERAHAAFPVYPIGVVTNKKGSLLCVGIDGKETPVTQKGYRHF